MASLTLASRELRVERDRLLKRLLRFLHARNGPRPVKPRPPAHHEVVGVGIDRPFLLDPAANRLDELEVQGPGEAAGDLVLGLRQVSPVGVEPLRPQMPAGFGVDQLDIHPNLAARSPHAPFEHIADAEFAANLLHIDRFALVGKGGAAGDHKAARNP